MGKSLVSCFFLRHSVQILTDDVCNCDQPIFVLQGPDTPQAAKTYTQEQVCTSDLSASGCNQFVSINKCFAFVPSVL